MTRTSHLWRFVARRAALVLPLLAAVATLTFLLLELAPGDPIDLMLGDRVVSPEVRERLERTYGLDRPPPERFVRWLAALVRGDLGWSHSRARPVAVVLGGALKPTLLLSGSALAVNVGLGIALGVIAAARRRRWADRALTLGSLTVYAMPTFWLGMMTLLLLSFRLGWFPASGMRSIGIDGAGAGARAIDLLWHLALPATVLGLSSAAAMTRFVRGGLLEALGEPFVRAARARGADGRRALLRHALRNALLPVINLVGLSLPVLVSGSLVIEVVFGWPGMGRVTYEAIQAQDHAVVLAATLLASLLVALGSLLADLAMTVADPRVRIPGAPGR